MQWKSKVSLKLKFSQKIVFVVQLTSKRGYFEAKVCQMWNITFDKYAFARNFD